jgi:ABC-type lipoprotein release transport system permease subunit
LGVLSLLLRATARQRWRSWLLLALLITLVTGLVLAATAAGQRTATAYPRYEAAHGYDAFLFSAVPVPKIASLPEVSSVTSALIPTGGRPVCACTHPVNTNDFSLFEVPPKSLSHFVKLVAGKMPDQSDPHQVLASYNLAQDEGVRVGSVLRVPLASRAQRSDVLSDATFRPNGPMVALRVVGIEAAQIEFPATSSPSYDLYTTRAFDRINNPKITVLDSYFVRLHHGAADLPRFEAQARKLGGLSLSDLDAQASAIDLSIHPQAVGWWILAGLAGLAGLVGLVVIAQALARQSTIEADTYSTLRALGISRRQLVLLGMSGTLLIGAGGVVGGVALAFLLSPLTPVGEARLADPSPGFAFDPTVLLVGALAAILVTLALGVWPVIRSTRASESTQTTRVVRSSRIATFLSNAGFPPSALIGVRHALERGRGRTAVPVGSALLGSILAVTALCATAVFGASLTHLTHTPALYGQAFDLSFTSNQTGSTSETDKMLASFERAPGITDITAGISGDVSIDGRVVDAIAGQSLRGRLLATTTSGRLPHAGNEVALGATTLRQVGAHLGSTLRVASPKPSGGTRISSYRVVGTVVFSPGFSTAGLGTGAAFTFDGLTGAPCTLGRAQACVVHTVLRTGGAFLLRATPGAVGRTTLAHLAREYPSEATFPSPPTNLVNFGQAVNFPLLFGLVLLLFGAATLLHVLVVSVVRRRREIGLLRALGFVRRQVAFSVSWQTTTTALVGILVGVPAGIAVGRWVWRVFAGNLGVPPVPVVIVWVMVAIVAGTLLVANALAIGPALVAARSRPASLLNAE